MLQLSDLLSRFKNLTNTDRAKKELVGEEISKMIGVPVNYQQISFSKNTIFLKVQPIIKTEIALKKDTLLKKIKSLPGFEYISNIQ